MYSTMRITGLASGMDIDEIVANAMRVEKMKIDRVEQDKQVSLWRQEMYNSLNKDFANFIINSRKNFGLTSITYNGTFRPNSYQNLNWVKKATSSNEAIATVSSTSKVLDGNYKVEVEQLAEGVSLASSSEISNVNEDGKILDSNNEIMKELKFTINDGKKEYTIELNKDEGITMNDVVKAINQAKHVEGEGQNKKETTIGVSASYDTANKRFFLQTTDTGEKAQIKIITEDDDSENFINSLNLTTGEKIGEKDGKPEYKMYQANQDALKGKNAIINFNGAQGIESETNRITVNGITMDLKAEGNFNVNVATDVDGIYEKVEQFVKEYNELVEKTNKLLTDKPNRDYRPLTAEQKKAMDKADIDLWEEKAKAGLLRGDGIIQSTMLKTRQSIYEKFQVEDGFSGAFTLITDIGISTESYARGTAGGKLVIDEEKLKEAIAKDPEGVLEVLFKESTPAKKDENGNVIEKGNSGGLVSRIHDNLMLGMEEIIKKSGTGGESGLYRDVKGNILIEFVSELSSISTLDKDVLEYTRKIDDLNVMLFRKENQYYAKFTAMEKAISRMNQQSMWLMQQTMG